MGLGNWLKEKERHLRRSWGKDISTPEARRKSNWHYQLFDHAFLRTIWTNHFEIAPGVFRSNQPTRARFERYAADGLKSVINLRGEDIYAHYLFEKEACDDLGLKLYNSKLWARQAVPADWILNVVELLRTVERPLLFHCKSGADRASFVAAMYLMIFEDVPVEEARKQLGLKYIHLKHTKTGVQDYILDVYAADNHRNAIGFEEWLRTHYDPEKIQAGFDNRRPAGAPG